MAFQQGNYEEAEAFFNKAIGLTKTNISPAQIEAECVAGGNSSETRALPDPSLASSTRPFKMLCDLIAEQQLMRESLSCDVLRLCTLWE
jgi:hypothetical protein